MQDGCEHFSVYGAVEPTTGECCILELPHLNRANFQILLPAFAPYDPDTLHMVVMDHGRWQKAKALSIPENLGCLF